MSKYSAMVVCQCGCGLPAPIARQGNVKHGIVKGQAFRFRVGHNQRVPRADGRHLQAYDPSTHGVTYVHVQVAERALGRRLPSGAEVHHVDGARQNNRNKNLVICQDKAYHKLLHYRARIVRAGGNPNTDKVCCDCHAVKSLDAFNLQRSNKSSGRQSVCRACGKLRDELKRRQRREVAA